MSQGGVLGSGPNKDNMRASDADRERIVEQLRKHTADGRLTMDEFEERMAAAYEAKTYGALSELTRDLPVDLSSPGRAGGRSGAGSSSAPPVDLAAVVAGAAADWRGNRHELRRQLRNQMRGQGGPGANLGHVVRGIPPRGRQAMGLAALTAGWASISVLLTGVWLIAGLADGGHFGEFWPIWPIGIMGLLTLVKGIRFFDDGR